MKKKSVVYIFVLLGVLLIIPLFNRYFELRRKVPEVVSIPVIRHNDSPSVDIRVLKIAHQFSEYSPKHLAIIEQFIPLVQEGSRGKIVVEVYPANQLGDEEIIVQGLSCGTIEMAVSGQSLLEEELSDIKMSDELLARVSFFTRDAGYRCLYWSFNGFKQLFLFDSPLGESEQTFRRLDPHDARVRHYTDLLFSSADLNFSFESDPAEGAVGKGALFLYEGTLQESMYASFWDSLKAVILSNHQTDIQMYMVSERFWNTLSNPEKELLNSAVRHTELYETELLQRYESDILKDWEENQVFILPVMPESPDPE